MDAVVPDEQARDAAALARATAELLDDPERRRTMGERGESRVRREFSRETLVEKTLARFGELKAERIVFYCGACRTYLGPVLNKVYGKQLPFELTTIFEWLLERYEAGELEVKRPIRFRSAELPHNRFATGDYYCRIPEDNASGPRRIVKNTDRELTLSAEQPLTLLPASGARVDILIRLQQPHVQPENCIGCGVCEHECPVRGKRAIRVTAENETRNPDHAMTLK